MDREAQSNIVDLSVVEIPSQQTEIVKKAIKEGAEVVFYSFDLNDSTKGFYVRLPVMIQAMYKCGECNNTTTPEFTRVDVLSGGVSLTRKCSRCRKTAKLIYLGTKENKPVVEVGTARTLEDYLPTNDS
jgi:DNA-directed RNA polymerase subunit RPC12/RpoP